MEKLSFDEFLDKYGEYYRLLEPENRILVSSFFEKEVKKDKEELNQALNLIKFGYKKSKKTIKKEKLFKAYQENKYNFNLKEQLYLECYYFEIRVKEDYINEYGDVAIYKNRQESIEKLERFYFHIDFSSSEFSFDQEKYLSIRETFYKKYGKDKTILLDIFYGLNKDCNNLECWATIIEKTEEKVKQDFFQAKKRAIAIYTNRSKGRFLEAEFIHPFLLNPSIPLKQETRKILQYFFIDNLSYNEISEKTNISNARISSMIDDGLYAIDAFRFGITTTIEIKEEEIYQILTVNEYTPRQKEIILKKFIEKMDNETISQLLNCKKRSVENTTTLFNKDYLYFRTKEITLTIWDITKQIGKKEAWNILTKEQRTLLSYYYGIENKYNPSKRKYTMSQMSTICKKTEKDIEKEIEKSLELIKRNKIGLYKAPLDIIDANNLELALKDIHCPLSEKEKNILFHLYEIEQTPYMSIEYFASFYHTRTNYIISVVRKAIITINKFLKGEIKGKISYTFDVEPNLKYFDYYERQFLIDFYKEELTYEKISAKYKMKLDYIIRLKQNLQNFLYELMENANKANYFDYDFAKNSSNDNILPFYGNVEIARKIYDLYTGNGYDRKFSLKEIVQIIEVPVSEVAIKQVILDFKLAICKFANGIKKEKSFTFEEVKEYFIRNRKNMNGKRQKRYLDFLETNFQEKYIKFAYNVPEDITYDLILDKEKKTIDLTTCTPKEGIKVLKEYGYFLTERQFVMALNILKIESEDFFTEEELRRREEIFSLMEKQTNKKYFTIRFRKRN